MMAFFFCLPLPMPELQQQANLLFTLYQMIVHKSIDSFQILNFWLNAQFIARFSAISTMCGACWEFPVRIRITSYKSALRHLLISSVYLGSLLWSISPENVLMSAILRAASAAAYASPSGLPGLISYGTYDSTNSK